MAQLNHHWSWPWEVTSHNDELTMAALTIPVLILAILWYKSTLSSSSNGEPPLPPGPRGFPIVGYLPFLGPNLHQEFTNMARTHGPIFKLWLGSKLHVVVNTPDLAKVVVRDQDDTFANRNPPIAGLVSTYGGLNIVWSNNNAYWRNLRKIFVHEVLSNKNLEACRASRRDEVRKMIKDVYGKLGTTININKIVLSTEANVVTSMIWENASIIGAKDGDLGAEMQMVASKIIELVGKPNVSDIFPSLSRFDLQGIERDAKRQLERLDRIFTRIIDDRIESNSKNHEEKRDFLQILLDLKEQKNATSLNITQIKALLVDIMIAGTDTTVALIEWAMAEIMKNHNVMKRVQEELTEVVGLNIVVEECHLSKLQYLDAVIKETSRLHPVGPLLIPRSPSQTCTVGGYTVPKGCTVFVNVWAIHRDPRYWDNPLEFNPERFLTNKWDYNGNNLKFFPFGSGRRSCPGVPLAEKMLTYVLASLLHSFDWSLPMGEEHDLTYKFGIALMKAKPLVVIPSQRLPNASLYV